MNVNERNVTKYDNRWIAKNIVNKCLDELTQANFYHLRKKVAKLVNKELGIKLRLN